MRFLPLFFVCAFPASIAVAQQPPTVTAASAVESNPAGELTLDHVLSLALSRNPDIRAAELEVRAREGRLIQARTRPNPELSATAENLGGDAAETGGVQSTVELGQRIELGGDRAARASAANASRDLSRWDLESRKLEVAGRARLAFVNVLYAQRRVELADQTVRLAEELKNTVAARVEAGKVSPIEETRAEVVMATERIERDRAAADLNAARSRLAATWGSTTPSFQRVVGDLESVPSSPSFESLGALLERNPEVARWTTEIAEREAQLRVENARGVPDITVRGGYRHFELGSGAFVGTVAVPVPLFDRNRGAKIEARERIAKAQEERLAVRVRLGQAVAEAHASLARAEAEVRNLRDHVLPGAESVYAAVSEGYSLGKFGYMELLDARRTLAAVRAQLARAQAELHQAWAGLQQLTAAPINITTNGEHQ